MNLPRETLRRLDSAVSAEDEARQRLAWEIRKATLLMQSIAVHAYLHSKDPSTKAGAEIVRPDFTPVSRGYNGTPAGTDDSDRVWADRIKKYPRLTHAEANALDFAETSVRGCYMVCTVFPCSICAGRIVQRGISKVFHSSSPRPAATTDDSGKPLMDLGAAAALEMFEERGVQLIRIPGIVRFTGTLEFTGAAWD